MKFVGADLHKKSITFCVVESAGGKVTVVQRMRILCKEVAKIEKFLKSLGRCQVLVDATIGYDWFAALAEKHAQRVVIAHAGIELRMTVQKQHVKNRPDTSVTQLSRVRPLAKLLPHGFGYPSPGCSSAVPGSVTPNGNQYKRLNTFRQETL